MSTPIHQLPATPTAVPPTDDPEVLSMLNEMEKEVQEATKVQHQPMMRPPPPPAHVPMPTPIVKKPNHKKWWDQTIAQKAITYAVIAMIVFYPATLAFVYSKLPKFEALFNAYDFIIRTAVVAIALYAAMIYLPF